MFINKIIINLIVFVAASSQACDKIIERPEIRSLNQDQLKTLTDTIKKLNNEVDVHERLSRMHVDYSDAAHGSATFFPWHRIFIREYEKELQKINNQVILPYWDWSKDSQSPERSPIFTDKYFGGNGRRGDQCVTDGPLSNWKMQYPRQHCLKRDFDQGDLLGAFYSPEAIEHIIDTSKDYEDFRIKFESAPHARVHNAVRGDFGTMYSPNDPLFFLHHAFVDMLWNEWQLRNPNQSYPDPEEDLRPFDKRVSETLNTQGQDYCYTYPRYNVKFPDAYKNYQKEQKQQQEKLEKQYREELEKREKQRQEQERKQEEEREKERKRQQEHKKKHGRHHKKPHRSSSSHTNSNSPSHSLFGGLFSRLRLQSLPTTPALPLLNLPNFLPTFIPKLLPKLPLLTTDRSTPNRLRQVPPIPPSYLRANRLDPATVNRVHRELNDLTATLNALPNFIPVAQLL